MSKFGVGVGEDFPVDEKKSEEAAAPPGEAAASEARCCGGSRSEQHEAWRNWRHQKRDEWRARKRAMREQFRREFAGEGHREHAKHVAGSLAVAALAIVGLAALFGHRRHD